MLQLTDGQEINLDGGDYSWSEIHKIKLQRQRNGGIITAEQVQAITGRAVTVAKVSGAAVGIVAVAGAVTTLEATKAVGKAAGYTLKEASGWKDYQRKGESGWTTLRRAILGGD